MIDKELSKLKNDIPNININDYKSGVYKKYDLGKKRNKSFNNYSFAIVCLLLLMLIFSGFIIINNSIDHKNQTKQAKEDNYANSDKKFYANKFDFSSLKEEEEKITPYQTSFLEFDRSWYKIKVSPIKEYTSLYLDSEVYDIIMEVVFHENCSLYTEEVDGKEYVFNDFIAIEKQDIEDIKIVDGSVANLYFEFFFGAKTFKVDNGYLNLQEYLNYIGSDIVIGEENFIVENSNDIRKLPIKKDNYIAIAYFYYQEFKYLYNYMSKNEISKTVPYYGSMVAYENTNDNIYHNLLDNSKEYLLMDVPLDAIGERFDFFGNLKYNCTGKKEFIVFEINKIKSNEYVWLEENSDIETITLLSQGDNYDVLFENKVTTLEKEYYSINELIEVNKFVVKQWKVLSEYNREQTAISLKTLREIVPNKLADDFKIATKYKYSDYNFEIDTITFGVVIYETTSEVTYMEPSSTKVGFNYFNKTDVNIEQFNVSFMFEVNGKDINEVKDLISAQWVSDGNTNKLIITYDESLKGEKLQILCQYKNKKYYHQYISYLGATIDCYTNCVLYDYIYAYLG